MLQIHRFYNRELNIILIMIFYRTSAYVELFINFVI